MALARGASPLLRAAAAGTARSQASIRTARAYTNPQIEIFQGKQSARPIATPGVPGLLQHYAAYQTLEIPAERRARRKAAELATTSSSYGEKSTLLGLSAQVKHAFYEALQRKKEVEQAQQNEQLVQDLRRRVEVEVSVGEKGRLELTRAEAELARARFAVQSARIGVVNAIAQLRAAIAAPADSNLDPQGTLEQPIQLAPLEILHDRVMSTHPALQQSMADVKQADSVVAHERTLRIPQPTFFGEYERQPDLSFWRLGVSLPLPIVDRRQGQIAEAQALVRQSESALHQRELELNASLESAYEQYRLADEQVKSLEAGSLREAESAVSAAQAAYRFGERGIVEVLDAQRVLQGVRGDLLEAQYLRQAALVDLEELGALNAGGKP